MASDMREAKTNAGEKGLTMQMKTMVIDQQGIHTALQLLSKAIKREKTPELLVMRARLLKKTKR